MSLDIYLVYNLNVGLPCAEDLQLLAKAMAAQHGNQFSSLDSVPRRVSVITHTFPPVIESN